MQFDVFFLSDRFLVVISQASFIGAMAIADLVKSTLGPKGMVCSFLLVSRWFVQHVASGIIIWLDAGIYNETHHVSKEF